MRFILLSDYYDPIVKSGSIILGDLVEEFLLQGHALTVITFVDNQKKAYQITNDGNLKIIRIRLLSRKYGKVGRLFAELSYSKKIIKSISNHKDIQCDAIICYSPSIFYGKAINWLKKKYNSKAYLIVRDIFPKWALAAGIIKEGFLYNYLKSVESILYESSDIIGIESKSDLQYFKNYLLNSEIQIEVLNNWGSRKIVINKKPSYNVFLDESKINIIYGGNMGDAQDLFSLISSIDITILENRAVIYLIGSGDQFDKIKKFIKINKISNIVILDSIERDDYLSLMSKADIGLVSLNKKLLSNNYPLKMIGYIQLGKPVLASVNENNEIIQMIQENNIGLVSLATDIENFNNNLNEIIKSRSKRKIQSQNALNLYDRKFTVEVAAFKISSHFL